MKIHACMLFYSSAYICKYIKAVQTDSLLKQLLQISNHFLMHVFYTVLYFLNAGQNNLSILCIIKYRAPVFQESVVFIKSAFHHMVTDQI